MIAPRPRPTAIAAPRLRPARPLDGGSGGCSVTGSSSVRSGAGAGASGGAAGGGVPVAGGGGGAGRAPTIGMGPGSSGAESGCTGGSRTVPGSDGPGRRAGGNVMGRGSAGSDLEQLALLVLDRLVDLVDVLRGQVLELLLRAAHLVLARLAVLGDAVELLLGPPAHVAHGDLGVLALAAGHLDQVAAALLGELREDHADDLAVVGRVDAQVAVADGLLDGTELAVVVGLDDRHPRLGDGDRGHLRHGRYRAVVVDHDLVEHRRGGATGAARAEVLARDRHGLVQPLLGVEQGVVDHGSLLLRAGRPAGAGLPVLTPRRSGRLADERSDLLTCDRAGDVAVTE